MDLSSSGQKGGGGRDLDALGLKILLIFNLGSKKKIWGHSSLWVEAKPNVAFRAPGFGIQHVTSAPLPSSFPTWPLSSLHGSAHIFEHLSHVRGLGVAALLWPPCPCPLVLRGWERDASRPGSLQACLAAPPLLLSPALEWTASCFAHSW